MKWMMIQAYIDPSVTTLALNNYKVARPVHILIGIDLDV